MCTEADGASVSGFLALTCLWKAQRRVCEKIKNDIAVRCRCNCPLSRLSPISLDHTETAIMNVPFRIPLHLPTKCSLHSPTFRSDLFLYPPSAVEILKVE